MWVRGLKQQKAQVTDEYKSVAPHVGAWIETQNWAKSQKDASVAPHVGAWIETCIPGALKLYMIMSHPMWVRGLKQNLEGSS